MITCDYKSNEPLEDACGCPAVWVFVHAHILGVTAGELPTCRCAEHCSRFLQAVVGNDPSRRGSVFGRVPTYPFPQTGPRWWQITPSVWETWLRARQVRWYFEAGEDLPLGSLHVHPEGVRHEVRGG